MPNFPIDDRGYTFSHVLDREVKLSPAMQRLVRALNQHGNVDPVRDCGRGTGVNTVVALMDRGILREAKRSHGVHQVATTPAQVWDEACSGEIDRAYAEALDMDARRTEVINDTHRRLCAAVKAAGDQDMAAAVPAFELVASGETADRDRAKALVEAYNERDARIERDAAHARAVDGRWGGPDDGEQGWGQPDGMLAAPTFPPGTPEYNAYATGLRAELAKFAKGEEPYPYPPTTPAENNEPVIIEAHVEQMIETTERMEIPRTEWNAMTPAHRRDVIDTFGTDTMNDCGGYGASIISGAPDSDLDDQPTTPAEARTCGRPWVAEIELCPRCGQNAAEHTGTPAEARNGISDRAAVALADVDKLRRWMLSMCRSLPVSFPPGEAEESFDRIEAALRERR